MGACLSFLLELGAVLREELEVLLHLVLEELQLLVEVLPPTSHHSRPHVLFVGRPLAYANALLLLLLLMIVVHILFIVLGVGFGERLVLKDAALPLLGILGVPLVLLLYSLGIGGTLAPHLLHPARLSILLL